MEAQGRTGEEAARSCAPETRGAAGARPADDGRERALPAPGRLASPPASSEAVRKSMKGNRRCDTSPELVMRRRLREAGLAGYRLQWKAPGHPDIAWPGKKVALFVNGCFWHRCPHCKPSTPKSHVEYWTVKFERNVERDGRNRLALEAQGWTVHVVWECQLKKKTIDATMRELLPVLAEELGKELRAEALGAPEDGGAPPVLNPAANRTA